MNLAKIAMLSNHSFRQMQGSRPSGGIIPHSAALMRKTWPLLASVESRLRYNLIRVNFGPRDRLTSREKNPTALV